MGLITDPKNAVYNKVYKNVSVGAPDLISEFFKEKKSTDATPVTEQPRTEQEVLGYLEKFNEIIQEAQKNFYIMGGTADVREFFEAFANAKKGLYKLLLVEMNYQEYLEKHMSGQWPSEMVEEVARREVPQINSMLDRRYEEYKEKITAEPEKSERIKLCKQFYDPYMEYGGEMPVECQQEYWNYYNQLIKLM